MTIETAERMIKARDSVLSHFDKMPAEACSAVADLVHICADHVTATIEAKDADHAAEVERLKRERDGANERARMMFDAKNHWRDRATIVEARIAELERERDKWFQATKDALTHGTIMPTDALNKEPSDAD